MNRIYSNQKGFTLIEVLVVVVIMGINWFDWPKYTRPS